MLTATRSEKLKLDNIKNTKVANAQQHIDN